MTQKQETCSCGAKQNIRYKWINEVKMSGKRKIIKRKKVPLSRNELICHCDSCGKLWGTHISTLGSNMKQRCVVCGSLIKDQTETRYNEKGNYCNDCNAKCEHSKNEGIPEGFKKLLEH